MTKCRIDHIIIQNYKCIEHLAIDFTRKESDINIYGVSGTIGAGKTSVLECCALLLHLKDNKHNIAFKSDSLLYACIRVGQEYAKIEGTITNNNTVKTIQIVITPTQILLCIDRSKKPQDVDLVLNPTVTNTIFGHFPDPYIQDGFILFHSHRKIEESHIKMGDLFLKKTSNANIIKRRILKLQLSQARDILEIDLSPNLENSIVKVFKDFASVTIGKIRTHTTSELELLVDRIGNPSAGFSLNFLSAGQKELISTLFLILSETTNKPSVVLIDTPELHLNTEWCNKVISYLMENMPNNQYIIATHSQSVMDLIPAEHKINLD